MSMFMNPKQLWQAVLGELEVILSKANFTTWFKNTFISSISEDSREVIIGVPNGFTQAWLEKKYHKTILNVLQNISDNKIKKVNYVVEVIRPIARTPEVVLKKLSVAVKVAPAPATNGFGLNPRYTFDNFVVGKKNELACAACRAVVDNPGTKYNPLFIYGGVGLGKTHLLQAIGHTLLKRKGQKKKILYTSAEKFTREFIEAIRHKTPEKFKNAYRKIDILLIDDIQFIAGKKETQEEFFHTFNTLIQGNSQIVLSSDRPPKAIPALEERLKSRFGGGMIADISSPELETRMAILGVKAREKGYTLAEDIVQYIASHIQENVRELEGALNRIIAHHELADTPPSLESVKQILASFSSRGHRAMVNVRQLINTVADFYEVKLEEMAGKSRKKELVIPRQVAMFLMRQELESSFPLIGKELGGRDHTTAMHAYNKIREEMAREGRIKQEIDFIKQRIYTSP